MSTLPAVTRPVARNRSELKALAATMSEDQRREIDELKAIKQAHFGNSGVPMMMHHEDMENAGMLMPGELAQQPDVDKAFIDSMLPHHAGAIQMASVALRPGAHRWRR